MKNTFKLLIISLALVVISCACQREDANHHWTIGFINKSKVPIYVDGSFSYPDTLFNWSIEALASQPHRYKIEPDNENRIALQQRTFYENIFIDGRQIPSDTLIVFVFDAEQLVFQTPDDHINKSIIQYYYLSLADLKYLNWKLTYPPTPEMSTIKMYPPYKQTE